MKYALINEGKVSQIFENRPILHPDILLIECGDGVQVGWGYDGEQFTAPPVPTPEQIAAQKAAQTVTMRQARLALLGAEMLTDVNNAIAAMTGEEGEAARIEWGYAATVVRGSPLVAGLAEVLELDEAALDNLFEMAAGL